MTLSRPWRTSARRALPAVCAALIIACSEHPDDTPPLPTWSYDPAMLYPADRSLVLPEDGVALPDGRLIVTDQVHGLRVVETDGRSAPFGDLAGAGYVHRPPDHNGGANGLSLEPDGAHLLLTDSYYGEIYRVNVATGAAEVVYRHPYGVNTAVRDSRGAIWFTQSTANTDEARMWAAVDVPTPDGALFRLASRDGRLADTAEVVVDSLLFANGVVIDEQAGRLYLGETIGNRVLRFRVDLDAGTVSDRSVFADIAADNVELDGEGHLWVVAPLSNEVVVVNTTTGERQTVFRSQTPEQAALLTEFLRRGEAGAARMDLVTPALWTPLPGILTGVIVGPGNGPVYITGLGDALIRLTR